MYCFFVVGCGVDDYCGCGLCGCYGCDDVCGCTVSVGSHQHSNCYCGIIIMNISVGVCCGDYFGDIGWYGGRGSSSSYGGDASGGICRSTLEKS